MGTPIVLPFKNGLGTYMSPAMQQRYPGIEFSQFTGAEMMAKKYGLEKAQLDAYALGSHQRAIAAARGAELLSLLDSIDSNITCT